MDNAIKMAINENGPIDTWNWPNINSEFNSANAEYLGSILKNHLKIKYYCSNNNSKCFNDVTTMWWKTLKNGLADGNGTVNSNAGKTILQNGMRYYVSSSSPSGKYNNTIGSITIDINGKKAPNRLGYDVFSFVISPNGLDLKKKGGGMYVYYNPQNCNIKGTTNAHLDGISCGYWILLKGNLDYKYRDVSSEYP